MASEIVGLGLSNVTRISGMHIKFAAVFICWQGCWSVKHASKSSRTCYFLFTSWCTSGGFCLVSNLPRTLQCRF